MKVVQFSVADPIVHLLLNRNVQRFLFAGAMFGVLFPVSAILFEIYRHNYPLNLSSIIMIHNNSPILFMIDTAPFFFGYICFCCRREKCET